MWKSGRKNKGISNGTQVKKKRHAILAVVAISGLMLFFGPFLGAVFMLLLGNAFPNQSPAVRFVMNSYFPFIGLVIVVLLYCALWEKDIFKTMRGAGRGGMSGNNRKMLALGLVLGFGANGFCILLAWMRGSLTFSAGNSDLPYLLFAFVNVFVQSGGEEILSRGYMQGVLQKRYGIKTAILVNGLFFGLMHLANPGITVLSCVNTTLYGISMSVVLYYYNSLWFCIAHHTAWNFTQNFLFGLPNSGLAAEKSVLQLTDSSHSLFYDAQFGIEGGFVITVIAVVSIAAIVMKNRKKA